MPKRVDERALFNAQFPEAAALGKQMYEAGKGSQPYAEKNLKGHITDMAIEDAAIAAKALPVAQDIKALQAALNTTTKPEDRILLQEEIARQEARLQEEQAGPETAARARAANDVASLEAELKKEKDPIFAAALQAELDRKKSFLGSTPAGTTVATATPVVSQAEIATLKRFIENPGTNATERGKARLKLAELEAAQGNAKMPALQRNYDGVSMPAGESAPKGAYVTTAPPLGAPKAAAELPRIDLAREKVTEVTADSKPFYEADQKEREARINETLNEPNIRGKLQMLQEADQKRFPDSKPTAERTGFLEQGLKAIFGDMFDKEDLVRFSVLAAGGLLTGGSVAGSIRYAGLNTLQNSDKRRAQEAAEKKAQEAARANLQKELRADLRRMDADSIKALDKKAPDVQAQAIQWMNEAKALEMQGKYEQSRELYRRANMWLTANPDLPTGNEGKSGAAGGFLKHDSGLWRGKPATFRSSKDGSVYEVFPQGGQGWIPVKDPGEFETDSQFRQHQQDIEASTAKQLEGYLRPMFGKGRAEDASIQAKSLAPGFAALRHELGRHVTPAQFGQMAEITIRGLNPEDIQNGRISPEALRRSFFVNGVMMLRKGDIDLVRSKEGKVDAIAHGYFKDMLEDKIASNKSDPSYGLAQASDEIIAEWNKLPAAEQKRFTTSAQDGRAGMTGFLRWVEAQREKPKK